MDLGSSVGFCERHMLPCRWFSAEEHEFPRTFHGHYLFSNRGHCLLHKGSPCPREEGSKALFIVSAGSFWWTWSPESPRWAISLTVDELRTWVGDTHPHSEVRWRSGGLCNQGRIILKSFHFNFKNSKKKIIRRVEWIVSWTINFIWITC